jgi:hypothetical protein
MCLFMNIQAGILSIHLSLSLTHSLTLTHSIMCVCVCVCVFVCVCVCIHVCRNVFFKFSFLGYMDGRTFTR